MLGHGVESLERRTVSYRHSTTKEIPGNRIISEYVQRRRLGGGAVGTVFLVQHQETHDLYAMKVIRRQPLVAAREVSVMQFIEHPNVVRLYHVIHDELSLTTYIVMDYMDKGSLEGVRVPPAELRRIATEVGKGLLYLHSLNFTHRDLKPANVLIDSSQNVKICDLGCCEPRGPSERQGTPAFSCPELLLRGEEGTGGEVDGECADSWAFGMTVLTLSTGALPFPSTATTLEALRAWMASPLPVVRAGEISDAALADLLGKLLEKDPAKRSTLADVAHHPFFLSAIEPQTYDDTERSDEDDKIIEWLKRRDDLERREIGERAGGDTVRRTASSVASSFLVEPMVARGAARVVPRRQIPTRPFAPPAARYAALTDEEVEAMVGEAGRAGKLGNALASLTLRVDHVEIGEGQLRRIVGCENVLGVALRFDRLPRRWPEGLVWGAGINHVDVQYCGLVEFPTEVLGAVSLQTMGLQGNQIEVIPQLPSTLRRLNMRSNALKGIFTTAEAIAKLETLNITDNVITWLPTWDTFLRERGFEPPYRASHSVKSNDGLLISLNILVDNHPLLHDTSLDSLVSVIPEQVYPTKVVLTETRKVFLGKQSLERYAIGGRLDRLKPFVMFVSARKIERLKHSQPDLSILHQNEYSRLDLDIAGSYAMVVHPEKMSWMCDFAFRSMETHCAIFLGQGDDVVRSLFVVLLERHDFSTEDALNVWERPC